MGARRRYEGDFTRRQCTPRQAALLRKFGYSGDVSPKQAATMIGKIKAAGWRRPDGKHLPETCTASSNRKKIPDHFLYEEETGRFIEGWYGKEPIYANMDDYYRPVPGHL